MSEARQTTSSLPAYALAACLAVVVLSSIPAFDEDGGRPFIMGLMYWPQHGGTTRPSDVHLALDRTLPHTNALVAQVPWSPTGPPIVEQQAWIASLAVDNNLTLGISLDWMEEDRTGHRDAAVCPWSFSEQDVRSAFLESITDVLAVSSPDYFVLGVEVNYLLIRDEREFEAFVEVYRLARRLIRSELPRCKVTVSFQYEVLVGHEAHNRSAPDLFGDDLDVLGISTYPLLGTPDPTLLAHDYYDGLSSYGKPIAVCEFGWPTLSTLQPSLAELHQSLYMDRALRDFARCDVELAVWTSSIDSGMGPVDKQPHEHMNGDPKWRWHLGLWTIDGRAKRAAQLWKEWLERPLSQRRQ